MLYRMFKDLNPDGYCLLYNEAYEAFSLPTGAANAIPRLPARYYYLSSSSTQPKSKPKSRFRPRTAHKFVNGLRLVARLGVALFVHARDAARIVEREKYDAIMACSGDLLDLPAGYLASRLARVPFYAYLFDDYLYQWQHFLFYYFARIAEPRVLKGAAGIIVPNEYLCNDYFRRYKVEPMVIHNPVELPEEKVEAEANTALPWPANDKEISIVYTGTVYHAHYTWSGRVLVDRSYTTDIYPTDGGNFWGAGSNANVFRECIKLDALL
jgi:Glycosyltransferase Family 4